MKLINKVNNELHLITFHKAVKEAQALLNNMVLNQNHLSMNF